MYCRNCGQKLGENADYCTSCGVRVSKGNAYCQSCGAEAGPQAEVCVKCGVTLVKTVPAPDCSTKSRLATTLLVLFLGELGAHRFYIGKSGTAIIMLILAIVGWSTIWLIGFGLLFLVPLWVWCVIDFIFAVSGNLTDSKGKRILNW